MKKTISYIQEGEGEEGGRKGREEEGGGGRREERRGGRRVREESEGIFKKSVQWEDCILFLGKKNEKKIFFLSSIKYSTETIIDSI